MGVMASYDSGEQYLRRPCSGAGDRCEEGGVRCEENGRATGRRQGRRGYPYSRPHQGITLAHFFACREHLFVGYAG